MEVEEGGGEEVGDKEGAKGEEKEEIIGSSNTQ